MLKDIDDNNVIDQLQFDISSFLQQDHINGAFYTKIKDFGTFCSFIDISLFFISKVSVSSRFITLFLQLD